MTQPPLFPDPPADLIRHQRLEMLNEWRMIGGAPPRLHICAGFPKCDGLSPETCRACFSAAVNDGRSTNELLAAYRDWKRQ